ncbi:MULTISPECIES: choice-of-anchor D domain-containing protein [unclassified Polaribacter]|uniref:choice-of-anchor D domain-containing protein n=1 Tax=unclassified Polaribacter TaxID=196858 RepID=UPI0011BF3079|nr:MULTISPECIES: choice-of-anchor D domain-containing protein [unclassified Polaribacter]TXD53446.1 choice-of-anchor D domain-containing protein [Polaribacter sp. IC063]TXD61452.1 choice-of-anchor D domain-containing protein [Polaribacter sp. IC066]
MKAFYTVIASFFLVFIIQSTEAQNSIVFDTKEIGTATNFDFDISLNNADEIAGLQFDITFNAAVFELVNGHQLASRADSHTLAVSNPSEGVIRVLVYSDANAAIRGNSGVIINLKLKSKTLPGTFNVNDDALVVSSPEQTAVSATIETGAVKVLGPILNITSSEVNFGRVPIGSGPQRTVSIKNDGNLDLALTGINTITPFSIQESFPISIAPNSSKNLTLNVNSGSKYNSSETVRFQNNDADPLRKIKTVVLKAEVFAVNEIRIGAGNGEINTAIEIPVVIENMEPFNGFQFDIKLPNDITYVENSLVFSDRLDGHSVSASLINPTTLRFLGYSSSNKNFKGTAGTVFSFQLKPNVSSGNYPLRIEEAILTHTSLGDILSDAYNGAIQINAPNLSLSTSLISYGTVPITETRETTIRLSNSGSATLNINEVMYDATALSLDVKLPLVIEAGQFEEVKLTFTPKTAGNFSKAISFRHNGADVQNVLNVSATIFSPNYVLVENVKSYKDQINKIQIVLKNNDAVKGVQFDVELPIGFRMDVDAIRKTESTSDFSLVGSQQNNTAYRIILYSSDNSIIATGDTAIIELPVFIEDTVALGDYEFQFLNTVISDVNNKNISSTILEKGLIIVALKDSDGDGVADDEDTCADTPAGETVDSNGCATSQVDSDGDGVTDDKDTCADTPAGETVDSNGCSDTSLRVKDEVFDESIFLFPNPVLNILSIESEVSPILKVQFYSIVGEKVKEIKSNFNSIITNDLSRGIYLLQIYSDKGITNKRLIKN